MKSEPLITIFGKELTEGQRMTIRVSLEVFISHLLENGLGDNEHGKEMVKLYLRNIDEIRALIFGYEINDKNK